MPKFTVPDLSSADIARFWSHVAKGESCWEWDGWRSPKGYGRFVRSDDGRKYYYAHRVALFLKIGVEVGLGHALHHCDNPPCVRPDHLYLGSAEDNVRDRRARTGWPTSISPGTTRKCLRLRRSGQPYYRIASILGISVGSAWRISHGQQRRGIQAAAAGNGTNG